MTLTQYFSRDAPMEWLTGVVFALFALARLTATTTAVRTSPGYATELMSWYRAWAVDSSDHPATAAELRQMLEAYRQGRRRGGMSSLPETMPVILEVNGRQPATAAAR